MRALGRSRGCGAKEGACMGAGGGGAGAGGEAEAAEAGAGAVRKQQLPDADAIARHVDAAGPALARAVACGA